ncbi:MAG TPA: GGDEF domain-containing protein [Usitatibacter sp.]|nr:GGDEF domain-containing protein [Usitatibacter sp.]
MVDLPTLWAFLALADALLAAIVGIGMGLQPRDGVGAWSASLAVRAVAFTLFAAPIEPRAGSLAVAAGLIALSLTLQAAALLAFDRRQLPAWVHSAAVAAVAVPIALVAGDPSSAILFGGLVFGTLAAGVALLALQGAHGAASFPRILLAGCYAACAAALTLRGVAGAVSADPLQAFLAPTPAQSLAYLAGGLAAIASSFSFLLLQKERADAQALRLATLDPLTGAYNRRTFHEIAEREMSRARRGGQPLSIVMLDIDHCRAVNEKHGLRAGDELIRRIGEVLRATLRKEDMLFRYGGEEFLVLLPDVPGPGAVIVAGRLRKAVAAEEIALGDARLAVTVSAGVAARLDEGPESIDTLVARAEEALALAKRRGRNRVVALSLGRSIAA